MASSDWGEADHAKTEATTADGLSITTTTTTTESSAPANRDNNTVANNTLGSDIPAGNNKTPLATAAPPAAVVASSPSHVGRGGSHQPPPPPPPSSLPPPTLLPPHPHAHHLYYSYPGVIPPPPAHPYDPAAAAAAAAHHMAHASAVGSTGAAAGASGGGGNDVSSMATDIGPGASSTTNGGPYTTAQYGEVHLPGGDPYTTAHYGEAAAAVAAARAKQGGGGAPGLPMVIYPPPLPPPSQAASAAAAATGGGPPAISPSSKTTGGTGQGGSATTTSTTTPATTPSSDVPTGSPSAAPRSGRDPPPHPHYPVHHHHHHLPPPPPGVPSHHAHAAAAYHRHNAAAAAAWAEAAAAAAAAYPPRHGYHPHSHPYEAFAAAAAANASYKTAAALAAEAAANGKKKNAQHAHHLLHRAPPHAGPYRFSDPTLRREALSRLATEKSDRSAPNSASGGGGGATTAAVNASNGAAPPSASASAVHHAGAGILGPRGPPDPTAALLLELEARGEGATSPSQIEDYHREEVTTMGCTCKKTKCLKLYCQCFAVKIYCGANCRCLTCHNSMQFEVEREDAIRTILSRNPSAFETKFQKNQGGAAHMMGLVESPMDHAYGPAAAAAPPPTGPVVFGGIIDSLPARVLSHKLGCKCRKSACMKKYCECYAGSVKCSSNCRCVGCKNMPPGGFENDSGNAGGEVVTGRKSFDGSTKLMGSGRGQRSSGIGKREPTWMMDAAQNLAFLKHGSPAVEKPRRTLSGDKSESGSMPSLTSSEESPTGSSGAKSEMWKTGTNITKMPPPTTAERAAVNQLASSEKTAVNALLMAAMAMTSMSGTTHDSNSGEAENSPSLSERESDVATTPPVKNTYGGRSNEGTPEGTSGANVNDEDNFETPQRNLLGKFTSPKRKASEASPMEMTSPYATPMSEEPPRKKDQQHYNKPIIKEEEDDDDDDDDVGEDDESPKRVHPGDGTPGIQQKVKRSRLGSLKKSTRLMAQQLSNGGRAHLGTSKKSSKAGVTAMDVATPAKCKEGSVADLTPVSARCIDFKKMRVNDSSSDPAIADSATT